MTQRISALAGLFALAAGLASAQTLTSLNGVVSDPSGAVVPNTTVELTNVDTNGKRDHCCPK